MKQRRRNYCKCSGTVRDSAIGSTLHSSSAKRPRAGNYMDRDMVRGSTVRAWANKEDSRVMDGEDRVRVVVNKVYY